MDKDISALVGVVLGFALSSVAAFVRSNTVGRRFENAVRAELSEAKEVIHRKMRWILRDESGIEPDPRTDPNHVIPCYGRLLYLGEPEQFSVNLPFWEQNTRVIVEVTPARPFAALFQEIVHVNQFVSKFRDMKLAFSSGLGDARWMAVACLGDMISIHDRLIPEHAIRHELPDAETEPNPSSRDT